MYQRFTERARRSVQLANTEALRRNHEYIDTGHLLLGILEEGNGIAMQVLKNRGVNKWQLGGLVDSRLGKAPDKVLMGKLPQTPAFKKVVEYAISEARDLGHEWIGTEHLLAGILREGDGKKYSDQGVAYRNLRWLGVTIEGVLLEIIDLVMPGRSKEQK